MSDQRETLTWSQFGKASIELAEHISADGYIPDIVIAVARGGLIPAGALSYALGVKAAGTLNVEFYTDIAETLETPHILEPALDTNALRNKRILVVDDVADSGKTLEVVTRLVAPYTSFVKIAVLYAKSSSIVTPHYFWKKTDKWINFPWSTFSSDDHSSIEYAGTITDNDS